MNALIVILALASLSLLLLTLYVVLAGLERIPAVKRYVDGVMPEHPWWIE